MIRHAVGLAWHLGGIFLAPFVLGFVAALFVKVSEVGETLPVLLGLSAVLIVPAFVAQLVGLVLKSARDLRALRAKRGSVPVADTLATLHRHARIVTPRGWAVLFSGLFAVLLALAVKWAGLSVLGVLALLLFYAAVGYTSLLSALFVGAFASDVANRRGSIERAMVPAVVLAGDPAEERFVLRRVPVPPLYNLLLEDRLPVRLGTTSRYAVGAGARREERVLAGRLRRSPRGLYALGPADVYYQDVLGLTRISVAAMATAELKVLPRFRDLVIVEPPRARMAAPDLLSRPHRLPTEDLFRFRDYAPGDDTRRISWKLSVRAGRLHVRQPESREISTQTVLLVLDSFLPRGRMLDDAVGIEEVLDRLVETCLALARELVDRGNRVTLVAAARQPNGSVSVETLACARGSHARWQDLGARACWQAVADVPQVMAAVGTDVHGVVVSSRFEAPPPAPFAGASLTWVFLPPHEALGERDPSLVETLAGSRADVAWWLFRSPHPAGADEDGLLAQLRTSRWHALRLQARARLRAVAREQGDATLRALVARGDAVYRLQPGAHAHRLVGVSAGHADGAVGRGA